ncbi:unnamed protein product [Anthophora retusa]
MEQGGVSVIPISTITDNSVGKSKNIAGIAQRSSSTIQAAKEKLKSPWISNLMKEDATGWETLTLTLAEVIGTAILVFIGCTGSIGSLGYDPSVLQVSITFGLAVMVAIQCVGHVSGAYINPSITVAALILGKKSLPMCLLYIGAQCLGGLIGFGLLKVITPLELMYTNAEIGTDSFCMTDIHVSLTTFQGVMSEFIATGILIFFTCGLWDCRNSKNTDSAPIRFGLCITVLCLVFIPFSGCSLNPARTLGPAVWNGYWINHWVYWLGPIGGAIVAALLYRCLFVCNRAQNDPGQCE